MIHDDTELTRQLAELDDWITEACKRGAVPVLTGMNGDMDTVGSAIALAASNPNMMACGIHLGRVSKKVCQMCKQGIHKEKVQSFVHPRDS